MEFNIFKNVLRIWMYLQSNKWSPKGFEMCTSLGVMKGYEDHSIYILKRNTTTVVSNTMLVKRKSKFFGKQGDLVEEN